ncbi:hypothetical protein CYMTET_28704, partial [Cymbomonas tetramitiformis]
MKSSPVSHCVSGNPVQFTHLRRREDPGNTKKYDGSKMKICQIAIALIVAVSFVHSAAGANCECVEECSGDTELKCEVDEDDTCSDNTWEWVSWGYYSKLACCMEHANTCSKGYTCNSGRLSTSICTNEVCSACTKCYGGGYSCNAASPPPSPPPPKPPPPKPPPPRPSSNLASPPPSPPPPKPPPPKPPPPRPSSNL